MKSNYKQDFIYAAVAAVLALATARGADVTPAEIKTIAEEGFIYGLPIVMNYTIMYEYSVDKNSGQYKAPFNQIKNEPRVFTYEDTAVITPNSDTPYSFAWLDLRGNRACCPSPTPSPTPTPIPTPTPGKTTRASTSAIGRAPSLPSVAAAARSRVHEGNRGQVSSDATYTANRAGARRRALSRRVPLREAKHGAGNGAAQADWFVNGATPARGDLLPVLDLERSNGLTPAQLTTWVQDFLGRVYTRLGVRGIIYCSPSFWKNTWVIRAGSPRTATRSCGWRTGRRPRRRPCPRPTGRQELDVLAVHLGWHGRRDLRPSRHGSLQRHGPHEGADPLAGRA